MEGRKDKIRKNKIVEFFLVYGLAILVMLVIIGGAIYIGVNNKEEVKPYSKDLEVRLTNFEDCPDKLNRGYLPRKMFCQIPNLPDDFEEMMILVEYQKITDLSLINESYWKQPEFFPNWEMVLPVLQTTTNRVGVTIPNTYPADAGLSLKAGDSIDVIFFMRSSPQSYFYKGINLYATYPEETTLLQELPDGTTSIIQDVDKVDSYFEVTYTPDTFILEPSYPVFREGWAKKIVITINAKSNTPKGYYVLGTEITSPNAEQDLEWLLKYKTKYSTGGIQKIDRPWHQTYIKVV